MIEPAPHLSGASSSERPAEAQKPAMMLLPSYQLCRAKARVRVYVVCYHE